MASLWRRGTRPTSEATTMSDSSLRQEILDVFQWDPRIESAHIGVTVEHGVVTLTGAVASDDQRIATEQAISHVVGVRAVRQKVEVRQAAGAAWRGKTEGNPATD
jgi:osmotically-inducible protein OsmY